MKGTAVFGDDNGGGEASLYRYSLTRTWAEWAVDAAPTHRAVLFLMLNPSKATAEKPDPTITRCVGFAKRWGYGGVWVGNLFGFRATDPKEMKAAADPVGPRNDEYLWHLAASASLIVCAWGNDGRILRRGESVRKMLHGFALHCLGVTKSGEPKHPLYLRGDAEPVPFPAVQPEAHGVF